MIVHALKSNTSRLQLLSGWVYAVGDMQDIRNAIKEIEPRLNQSVSFLSASSIKLAVTKVTRYTATYHGLAKIYVNCHAFTSDTIVAICQLVAVDLINRQVIKRGLIEEPEYQYEMQINWDNCKDSYRQAWRSLFRQDLAVADSMTTTIPKNG